MTKATPIVQIELDKPRNLRFDFAAFMAFEKETGKNILQENVWGNITATDLVTLLWAALKHEDKDLTLEQVGSMIHLGNIKEITQKLQEAFEKAIPDVGGKEEGKNRNRPTG